MHWQCAAGYSSAGYAPPAVSPGAAACFKVRMLKVCNAWTYLLIILDSLCCLHVPASPPSGRPVCMELEIVASTHVLVTTMHSILYGHQSTHTWQSCKRYWCTVAFLQCADGEYSPAGGVCKPCPGGTKLTSATAANENDACTQVSIHSTWGTPGLFFLFVLCETKVYAMFQAHVHDCQT